MAEWRILKTEDFVLWGDIFIFSVNRLTAWLVFCIQNQFNSSSERFQRKLIYIWQFNVRVVRPSWKVDATEKVEEKQVSLPYKHIKNFFFFEGYLGVEFSSVQFSSVAQSCPTLRDPMNRSTPGLPVHHHLPEFIQTQVHQVSDAIQPSHPLSSPSPPAPNPSHHQSWLIGNNSDDGRD